MCDVVGLIQPNATPGLAPYTYATMYHQNHRGQNSAGIVVSMKDGSLKKHRGLGTLDRVFFRKREELNSADWQGVASLGHIRYATSGLNFSDPESVRQAQVATQPITGNFLGKPVSCSFNGNLSPSCIDSLYQKLYRRSPTDVPSRGEWVDTELIIKSIELSKADTFESALLEDAVHQWQGAFSIIFLYNNTLYAIRDPWAFRPLEYGSFKNGYIIASEDNIFSPTKLPDAQHLSSINPGTCLILKHVDGMVEKQSIRYAQATPKKCAFEDIYFKRQDSHSFEGDRVALFRKLLGEKLAEEQPPPNNADFVVGVPDSGIHAARGYAEGSNLLFLQEALFRIHGAERSFLEPVNDLRKTGIELKLDAIPEYVSGKSIVVVDDSIVRGNVTPRVVYLLKMHGAREVHMRVTSPPIIGPCYYGIDTWRIESELIARSCNNVTDIKHEINNRIKETYGKSFVLNSLAYLSIQGLQSMYTHPEEMCYACWNNEYPTL
jgi:amidophosphoribosyltransferase